MDFEQFGQEKYNYYCEVYLQIKNALSIWVDNDETPSQWTAIICYLSDHKVLTVLSKKDLSLNMKTTRSLRAICTLFKKTVEALEACLKVKHPKNESEAMP